MHVIISLDFLFYGKSVYSLEEGTMKDKSVFIFSGIIVIALAVLAVAAFVYSLSEMPMDKNPEHRMISEAESSMDLENASAPEQNVTEGTMPFPKTGVSPQDTMKIVIFLFSVCGIICTQLRNGNGLRMVAGVVYALTITLLLGKWSIHMACVERGYEAVGGEYCLVYIVSWVSGTAINLFLDSLEDFKYERTCRKEGS